jgi:RNA polymerase sigma-70 factor (ECF subfamily)
MTHHRSVDYIRTEAARSTREQRIGSEEIPTLEMDDGVVQSESTTRVNEALNQLSDPLKEAIVTAFYGKCTYKEAALVLGQPEGTIKARIRKGLAELRIALSESHGTEQSSSEFAQSSDR